MTTESLNDEFTKHGAIESAIIVTERGTKRSKGFGFVTFKKRKDADAMIQKKTLVIGDRELQVRPADPRPNRDARGRTFSRPAAAGGEEKLFDFIYRKVPSITPLLV